jgi:heme/copper-type cytochrome/quinol oxidase subunit 3
MTSGTPEATIDASTAAATRATATSRGSLGMWIFLAADAASFAALLIAYAVLRARAAAWPDALARLNLPLGGALTYILLASSTTMALAVGAARAGRPPAVATRWLWATIALGALFVAGQALEWRTLVAHGIGVASDQAAASYYVCTGWHGAHVIAGLALLVTRRRAANDADKLAVAALFWHFVDAVWIVVFTSVYLA